MTAIQRGGGTGAAARPPYPSFAAVCFRLGLGSRHALNKEVYPRPRPSSPCGSPNPVPRAKWSVRDGTPGVAPLLMATHRTPPLSREKNLSVGAPATGETTVRS